TAGMAAAAVMVLLPAGSTVALSGTTWAEDSSLGGTVEEDRLLDFECGDFSGYLRGQLLTRVVRNGLGELDFYYRVWNDSSSTGGITDVLVSKYPQAYSGKPDGVYVEY